MKWNDKEYTPVRLAREVLIAKYVGVDIDEVEKERIALLNALP